MSGLSIAVPVGMHPDLFGGETPILQELPCELHRFEVSVVWTVRERGTVRVLAQNEEEARRIAEEKIEADEDAFDIEADDCEELPEPPSPEQIRDYLERTR